MEYIYLRDAAAGGAAGIAYREVEPLFGQRRPPPDFFFGPVPPEFGEWFFNDRGTPGVGLVTVDNVELSGNLLLVRDGAALCLPENGLHPAVIEPVIRHRAADPAVMTAIDEEVVVLAGSAYGVFGHWIVDYMPRLHILTACGYDIASCRYLLPRDFPDFALEWMARLGIARDRLIFFDPAAETCVVRRALVPTNLRGNGRASPLMAVAAKRFRDMILGLDDPVAPVRDIYLSRLGWGNKLRQLRNAEAIQAIATGFGYEIVHPQDLGIVELLRMFAGSRHIVGEYGSALHGSIFAGARTTVTALRPTTGHPGFLQSGLCEVLGQTHGYVFGHTEMDGGAMGFTIDPNAFRLALEIAA